MATIYLDAPADNTNLRAVFSSAGQYLRSADGVLEAFDDVADYRVSAAGTDALTTGLDRYRFTVPVPAVLPVTLDYSIHDIDTDELAGSGQIILDASGNEQLLVAAMVQSIEAGELANISNDVDTLTSTTAAIVADTSELQTLLGGTPIDGKSVPDALQIVAAVIAGEVSGAGTGTEIFVGLDGVTPRATVTVDAQGNRSAVVYGD